MGLTRRDVVLAGAASFIAWGLLVQQLPFLRYLGYAFATGSTLTLLAVLGLILTTSQPTKPSLRSIEDDAVLEFLTAPNWQREISRLNAKAVYRPEPLYPKSFVISDALDSLLSMAVRDFIQVWYESISPYPGFPNEVDKTIRIALSDIRDRLLDVDLTEVVVSRIVPILTAHLRDFDIAEKAVRGDDLKRVITSTEDLDLAIAKRYRGGEVHPAASFSVVDTKSLQQQHLRQLAARIVPQCVPADQIKSRAVSILITEIVACAVLLPTMQLLSDPDMLNQIMENVGRSTLQERRTVRKLRAALEQHASPPPRSKGQVSLLRLGPNDSERKFERYMRNLRLCDSLSDARRMRSEVTSQIKRDSRAPDQNQVYLKRLHTAKRLLDQKVAQLSADPAAARPSITNRSTSTVTTTKSRLETATLAQILQDASGLSYFMEYMDRQNQMTAVQFWIVVDGLRNPLEMDTPEDDDTLHGLPPWSASDRADLDQIYHAYFSMPDLRIPSESKSLLKQFLAAGNDATQLQYQKARGAVLRAQTATLEKMQKESLPSFRHSDLFYKLLTTEETSRRASMPEVPQVQPTISRNDSLPKKAMTRAARKVTPNLAPDTASLAGARDGISEPRTSSDSSRSKPVFSDEDFDDTLSQSRHSIDSDPFVNEPASNSAVEAVEAALNDIMENEPSGGDLRASLFGSFDKNVSASLFDESPRGSFDLRRQGSGGVASITSKSDKKRSLNIASLGLIDADSRGTVFAGDSLFPEEEKFIEDEREDDAENNKDPADEIHEAAPGDLGLAEAIIALTFDIDKLSGQEAVVDSLTKKAELTNNSAELRILRKSKISLQREIQRKELQRQQYIVQESDNSLYGKSSVSIPSTLVDSADGKEYAVYLIEVERAGNENPQMAKWAIARRYSEFHELHQQLRTKYPSTRHLDFPRRRVVMKMQKDFLEKRRQGLEKYLQELLQLPDVCRSRELRAFLSQRAILSEHSKTSAEQRDLISRFYSSVSEGVEDLLGNIPVLDQLSTTGHNILSVATGPLQQAFSRTTSEDVINHSLPQGISEDAVTSAEAEAELQAYESRELEPFVKPICDIFLELFELNKGGSWLRGRAVVVVLQQLLGGTIERKIRESTRNYFLEDNILSYIDLVKSALWPGGVLRKEPVVRTEAERAKSRREASLMLATLLPDLAAHVVGRANAQTASRRIYSTFNNSRLNVHICFTVLDELVDSLFPVSHRAS